MSTAWEGKAGAGHKGSHHCNGCRWPQWIAHLTSPALAGKPLVKPASPSQQDTPRPQSVHSNVQLRCPDRMRAVLFWILYHASESFHVSVTCAASGGSLSRLSGALCCRHESRQCMQQAAPQHPSCCLQRRFPARQSGVGEQGLLFVSQGRCSQSKHAAHPMHSGPDADRQHPALLTEKRYLRSSTAAGGRAKRLRPNSLQHQTSPSCGRRDSRIAGSTGRLLFAPLLGCWLTI